MWWHYASTFVTTLFEVWRWHRGFNGVSIMGVPDFNVLLHGMVGRSMRMEVLRLASECQEIPKSICNSHEWGLPPRPSLPFHYFTNGCWHFYDMVHWSGRHVKMPRNWAKWPILPWGTFTCLTWCEVEQMPFSHAAFPVLRQGCLDLLTCVIKMW